MSMSLHVYRYVILCLCVRTCFECLGACFKHTMVVSCFSVVCVLCGAASTCYMSMLMHVCVYIHGYSLAMSPHYAAENKIMQPHALPTHQDVHQQLPSMGLTIVSIRFTTLEFA